MAGFSRFEEIMHTKPSIEDPEMPLVFNKVRGDICFKDMSFGYDDNRLVLHHISLAIPAGKTIAFVGRQEQGRVLLPMSFFVFMILHRGKY